jgi:hypothetical protein
MKLSQQLICKLQLLIIFLLILPSSGIKIFALSALDNFLIPFEEIALFKIRPGKKE